MTIVKNNIYKKAYVIKKNTFAISAFFEGKMSF